jgi:isopentenyl phosphate kinase
LICFIIYRDEEQNWSILSGDTIASFLSEHLKPNYVTFITNVNGSATLYPGTNLILGVYNVPPDSDPSSVVFTLSMIH